LAREVERDGEKKARSIDLQRLVFMYQRKHNKWNVIFQNIGSVSHLPDDAQAEYPKRVNFKKKTKHLAKSQREEHYNPDFSR
jgi:hypothetical protein